MKRSFVPAEGSKERDGWDKCLDMVPEARKRELKSILKSMDEPGMREYAKGWMDAWDTFGDASWKEIKRRMPDENKSIKESVDGIQNVSEYVRSELRSKVFGVLVEAKNVQDWWEGLPGGRRRKVCDILGLNKGKDIADFDSFSEDEQAEIEAYFNKYKGKVEGEEIEGNLLSETSYSGRIDHDEIVKGILLIAQNDGESYKKRDVDGAVKRATKQWLDMVSGDIADDARSVQGRVVSELKKKWGSK